MSFPNIESNSDEVAYIYDVRKNYFGVDDSIVIILTTALIMTVFWLPLLPLWVVICVQGDNSGLQQTLDSGPVWLLHRP